MSVPPAFPLSPRGWSRWILAFLGQRQAEGPNLGALEMLLSYLIQLDPAPEAVPEVLARYASSPQASVAEAAVVLREAWLGQTGDPDTPSPSLQETLRSLGGLLDDWGASAAFMTVAENSAQFLGIFGLTMRRVLVDHWKKKHAAKSGGGVEHVAFDESFLFPQHDDEKWFAVHRCLERLEQVRPRRAKIV